MATVFGDLGFPEYGQPDYLTTAEQTGLFRRLRGDELLPYRNGHVARLLAQAREHARGFYALQITAPKMRVCKQRNPRVPVLFYG